MADCIVTGTTRDVNNQPIARVRVTIEQVEKTNTVIQLKSKTVISDDNGLVSLTLPRDCNAWISGAFKAGHTNFSVKGGVKKAIPDAPSATLESLGDAVVLTPQVPAQAGHAGQFLTTNGSRMLWDDAGGTPGGDDTEVQFNDADAPGGDPRFKFNKVTGILKLDAGNVTSGNDGTLVVGGDGKQHAALESPTLVALESNSGATVPLAVVNKSAPAGTGFFLAISDLGEAQIGTFTGASIALDPNNLLHFIGLPGVKRMAIPTFPFVVDGQSPILTSGYGSPEGVQAGLAGSLYTQIDGGSGQTLWVKESGGYLSTTGWRAIGSGSSSGSSTRRVRQTASGSINGSNTIFTLADIPTAGSEEVFLNGQLLTLTTDYTISNDVITLVNAPESGDALRVSYETGSSTRVVRSTPSGTINGSNDTFTLGATPTAGSEEIYLNGILQTASVDYTISSATITFVAAPQSGDLLRASYETSTSDRVVRATPSGTIDGSNDTFTLGATIIFGSEEIYLNGLLQTLGVDYTISGVTITMLSIPQSGDYLRASYVV